MARVVLTTGGTGGHIFPALATADALREAMPGIELLFIGATHGQEARLAEKAGLPFRGLPGRGVLGKGARAVPALWNNCKAIYEAVKILRSFRPCAVAAFGGYASFAPGVAAGLLRIPMLLHEQNAASGMSNRILSRWAKTVCLSLPNTLDLSKKTVVTGNPVRADIGKAGDQRQGLEKHLLVLGGSQGAHALNQEVVDALPQLSKAGIKIMHQTGQADYENVLKAYLACGYPAESVFAFIDNMEKAYGWADLALCRAGASTVAELCMAELPAILVPFPYAIRDHQTLNAKNLSDDGAAILLPEPRLKEAADAIISLFEDRHQLGSMSRACARLATPNAAANVASEILKLCQAQA